MLKLRLMNGPEEGRQLRVSDTNPVSIGRNAGRLRLHDSRVSKRHAEILFDDGAWIVQDVGSSNGTYLNHQRVEGVIILESGDTLQIGRIVIRVMRADDIGMDLGSTIDAKSATVDDAGVVDLPEPIIAIESDDEAEDDLGGFNPDEDEDLISLGSEPFDIDSAFDDLAEGLDDSTVGR